MNNPVVYLKFDGTPKWGARRIPVDVETTENTDFSAFNQELYDLQHPSVVEDPSVVEVPTIWDKMRRWIKNLNS